MAPRSLNMAVLSADTARAYVENFYAPSEDIQVSDVRPAPSGGQGWFYVEMTNNDLWRVWLEAGEIYGEL